MDDLPDEPPEAPHGIPTIADVTRADSLPEEEPPYFPHAYTPMYTAPSSAAARPGPLPPAPPLPPVAGPPGVGPAWTPPSRPRPPARRLRAVALGALFLVLILLSAVGGGLLAVAVQGDPKSSSSATPAPATTPPTVVDPNGASGGSGASGSGSTSPTLPLPDLSPPNSPSPASDLDVAAIAAKVNPGIVDINTTLADSGGQAAGTGMVLTGTGEIVTNNHVIRNAAKITVTLVATGEQHTARVLGYNVADDVALLKIDNVSGLDTVTIGNSSGVAVNDPIVAIGNALGRGGTPTATPGVVTAVDQTITAGDSAADTETLTDMIQIEAAIRPGDSGGALVDRTAKVIGMNTAADSGNGRFGFRSGGTGFAISINKVMSIAHDIADERASDRIHIGDRALLGVEVADVGTPGAGVGGVSADGPAEAAGISGGDTIVSLDGHAIGSIDDLNAAMRTHHPGDKVKVEWIDASGTRHSATVTLAKGPPE